MEFDLSTIDSRETSYQTAPLIKYSSTLQRMAVDLFQRIAQRVGVRRAKQYKGSFSIFATTSQVTVAKIVIHEAGKGKMNGDDPLLANGVYILVRTAGNQNARARTIGVAPKHHERFAYFKLAADQNLDEMADFIAACTAADRS